MSEWGFCYWFLWCNFVNLNCWLAYVLNISSIHWETLFIWGRWRLQEKSEWCGTFSQNKWTKGWGCNSPGNCLPRLCREPWVWFPALHKPGVTVHICRTSKFKANLGYMRPSLSKKKKNCQLFYFKVTFLCIVLCGCTGNLGRLLSFAKLFIYNSI